MALRIETDFPLRAHNTFGMDVRSDRFVEYHSEAELVEALQMLRGERLLNIGGGSNLLFCGDFHGTVLRSAIDSVTVQPRPVAHSRTVADDGSVCVRVGSGHNWDAFVARALENGWYGAENLSGIPGDVGASAVQNIGAYGAEIKDLVVKVEAINAETCEKRVFAVEECGYAYRDSIFKRPENKKYIITYVTYRLLTAFTPNLSYKALADRFAGRTGGLRPAFGAADIRREVVAMRGEKLPNPALLGNAGSFFMNPVVPEAVYERLAAQYPEMPHYAAGEGFVKLSAAWLIDRSGWKGRSLGPAGVYEKQPLVLVNRGGATGSDILALAEAVIADVSARFGVTLSMEVNQIPGDLAM